MKQAQQRHRGWGRIQHCSLGLRQVPGRITVGRSCAVSIACSRGSASPLAGLLCHCSSLELSAALHEPVRERVCVCIKILPKVVNNSTTEFIKFKSPRHSAGAFPKPGNLTAGLCMLNSQLQPTKHVSSRRLQAPGKPEMWSGCRCTQTMPLHSRYLKFMFHLI